jgi:uncharacterized membrane protein (TIGR02234 family)
VTEPAADGTPAQRRRDRGGIAALAAIGAGGGLALLAAGRAWATARIARPAPLPDLSVALTGRTIQAAVPGLAVVALAGLVALLATRTVARRIVAGLVAVTGTGMAAAALDGSRLSAGRARDMVIASRTGAVLDTSSAVHVEHHALWAVLAVLGGVLVLAGGVLAAVGRGGWAGLGRRYDAPRSSPGASSAAGDLALWKQLDAGEDPTTRTQS